MCRPPSINLEVDQHTLGIAGEKVELLRELPKLLPGAIAWAEARSKKAAEVGAPLTPSEQDIARTVGVAKPELVRVELVGERLPLPEDLSL